MATLRGQKPRLRHDGRFNSRHGIHLQAMNLIEVTHFLEIPSLSLLREM